MVVLHIIAWSLLAIVIFRGASFGIRNRKVIEQLRPPKHRHGDRLRRLSKREMEQLQIQQPRRRGHRPDREVNIPLQLDSEDLEELDGMFGKAGTDPSDY